MLLLTAKTPRILQSSLRMTIVLGLLIGLSGCDYVKSMFTPKTQEELYDDGVALGAGCRQAGQSLEECYSLNPKSIKSGIYAGWKEMYEYMAAMNMKAANDQTADPKPQDAASQIVDPKQDPGATAPKDDLQAKIAEARAKREARRAELEKDREEKRQKRLQAREAQEKRDANKGLDPSSPNTAAAK